MTVTQQVRNLLTYSKDCRNSDKELFVIYLQRAGMQLTQQQINLIKELPSFETIRRVRQKLQETEPNLRADESVRKARNHKSLEVQQNMPTAKPERVEQILEDGTKAVLPAGYRIAE